MFLAGLAALLLALAVYEAVQGLTTSGDVVICNRRACSPTDAHVLGLGGAGLLLFFGVLAALGARQAWRPRDPVRPRRRPRSEAPPESATPVRRVLFAIGDRTDDDYLGVIDREMSAQPAAAAAFLAVPPEQQQEIVAAIRSQPDDLTRGRELQRVVRRLAFSSRPELTAPPTRLDLEVYIQRLTSAVDSTRSDAVAEFSLQNLRDWPDDLRVELRHAVVRAMETESDPGLRDRLKEAIIAAPPPMTSG